MALHGPKGSHPTKRGWVSPKGELLKSARLTDAQIAEWHAKHHPASAQAVFAEPEPVVQTLHEAPVQEYTLSESEYRHHYGEEETLTEPEDE
jgi:hypothetical protein